MVFRQEMSLSRFRTGAITGQKSVSILCTEGCVWVTAGKGFHDIILRKGQQISLLSSGKVVMEALEDSALIYSHGLSEDTVKQAADNR